MGKNWFECSLYKKYLGEFLLMVDFTKLFIYIIFYIYIKTYQASYLHIHNVRILSADPT